MTILAKAQRQPSDAGYAVTFLSQMAQVLGSIGKYLRARLVHVPRALAEKEAVP
jgi:hypothetical protein